MSPSFVIVDHGCGFTQAELERVAAAIQIQLIRDLANPAPLGWGMAGTCRAATPEMPARDTEWMIGLFTDPDQPGALGYHDLTPSGQPLSKVFPLLDAKDGKPWSVTASHEVLETTVDPLLALCFQGPDGQIWAGEICDAVEALSYEIDGVQVSDFVLPAYFQLARPAAGVKLDYMGSVTSPLQILAGGYGQTFDPRTGWSMHDRGMRSARVESARARSRTVRRRYPAVR